LNLLLLEPDEIGGDGTAVVGGRRAHHIVTVLGAGVGASLRAGVVRGPTGTATVTAVERDRVNLEVALSETAPAPPRVELVLALPRPKALSRVVETAATLGVGRIDLVNAWRVDKSYFGSERLDPDSLRHHLVLGCEQGGTTWVPDIAVHRLLMPFIEGELARRCAGRRCLIAHPRAGTALEDVAPPGGAGPAVVSIGPEGGWIDRELASFADLGFAAFHMGPRVMRVETAVAAVLAQLELLARLPAAG
jgi:16S rRNA (uracil1498-N3)-methyltransferase